MGIKHKFTKAIVATVTCLFLLLQPGSGQAVDTDIYQSNVKQNAYVLMDNSTSMDFGVYESNIDYAAMFDYFFAKDEVTDTVMWSDFFLSHHKERNQIYLLKGNIGVRVITATGDEPYTYTYTGDAADPDYIWSGGDIIDLFTEIDADGNLFAAGGGGNG